MNTGPMQHWRERERNEQFHNTVKDLLLPDTVSQKDEKPPTTGLDDTAIVVFHMTSLKFKLKSYRSYRDFTFTMH